jgi:hypothetical protein
MDTDKRKVGRPKAPPRTGPIVLGDDRGRTKVTLEISERAASELAAYTRWVEQHSGMTASEARFKTVDFALHQLFRRDPMWQEQKRTPAMTAPTAAPPPAPRAASTNPPSLPPPAPREPRVNP